MPRGILHSIFWSLAFGLIMAISFILAIPDLAAAAKDGANSWFNLFNNLPAPKLLKDLLAIGIVVANYCCALAGLTSISRMVFAFSRDGGLPASAILRKVEPGPSHAGGRDLDQRRPVGGGDALLAGLRRPGRRLRHVPLRLLRVADRRRPRRGGQDLDRVRPVPPGLLVQADRGPALIGIVFVIYAGIQPPFDILINYAVGLLILLLVIWFGFERKRFQGPPIGDMIARRQAEIRAAERAVGEAGALQPERAARPRMRIAAVDQGTTSTRLLVVEDGEARDPPRRPSPAAPPAAGLGRARPAGAAGQRPRLPRGVRARWRRWASPTRARAASPGTGSPASRSRRSSSGRTTAPGMRSSGCAPRAPRPLTLERAGLPLDAYFSATKLAWLLAEVGAARAGGCASARLTPGSCDRLTGTFATDVTTASRTSLMNLATCSLGRGAVPPVRHPDRVPAGDPAHRRATSAPSAPSRSPPPWSTSRPRSTAMAAGSAGDAKVTFGTGAFALALTGPEIVRAPERGLLPTVAWRIGDDTAHAVDGGVYDAGRGGRVGGARWACSRIRPSSTPSPPLRRSSAGSPSCRRCPASPARTGIAAPGPSGSA